jgi:hypothetical protein
MILTSNIYSIIHIKYDIITVVDSNNTSVVLLSTLNEVCLIVLTMGISSVFLEIVSVK